MLQEAETSGTQVHLSTVCEVWWALLKNCGQKATSVMWKQDKTTQLCMKTQELGLEKWQQALCTDESKFELFGCSRRQAVCSRVGEHFNNECLQAAFFEY